MKQQQTVSKNQSQTVNTIPPTTKMSQSQSNPLLSLQETIGNRAMEGLVMYGLIQTKLRVGRSNDKYEQEADQVAEAIMSMPTPCVQRQEASREQGEDDKLFDTGKPLLTASDVVHRQAFEEIEDEEELLRAKVIPGLQRFSVPSSENPSGDIHDYGFDVGRLYTHSNNGGGSDVGHLLEHPWSRIAEEESTDLKNSRARPKIMLNNNNEANRRFSPVRQVAERIRSLSSSGQRLSGTIRNFFETRFRRDFSTVRLHTGSEATTLSEAINAHAFTYENHIWLGRGQTIEASPLLAHELVHVIQQTQPPILSRRKSHESPVTPSSKMPNGDVGVIQRFAPYWEPRGMNGTRTHREILPRLAGHGVYYEVPVPNASTDRSSRHSSAPGFGRRGSVDLYKSRGGFVPGIYFTAAMVPRNLPHRARYRNRAPGWTRRSGIPHVTDVGSAPSIVHLGDLKPSHGTLEAHVGADQIRNYESGIEMASREVNDMVAAGQSNSGSATWNVSTRAFSQGMLSQIIPSQYRYPGSGPSRQVVLKQAGRAIRIGRDLVTAQGRLILYPDPTNRGILNYVWIPARVATRALPGNIRRLGADVVRDILNPLRRSPIQRQLSRKVKSSSVKQLQVRHSVVLRLPVAIQRTVQDRFDHRRWRDRRRRIRDRFRRLRGTGAYRGAQTAALETEAHRAIQSRLPGSMRLRDVPGRTRETAATFERVRFWTSRRAGVFGTFRRIFGRVFVRIINAYERMRERFRSRFRTRMRVGAGGGLVGAAIKAVFSVAKMTGLVIIRQTFRVLLSSIRRGVTAKLRSLVGEDRMADLEARLDEVRRLRDEMQSRAVRSAQEFVERTIGPYIRLIDQVEQVRRVVQTATTIINLVRWGARAIACLAPPAVGCLWSLLSAVLEAAAAMVVQTCWFQRQITPWVLRLQFIRDLPVHLAGVVIEQTRRILPSSLHDVIAEPEVPAVRASDVACDPPPSGARAPTQEQLAVFELQQRLGEERFEALLRLSRSAGLPESTTLTSSRAQAIARIIETSGLSADDLERLADRVQSHPDEVPVDLRTFFQQTGSAESGARRERGREIARRLRAYSQVRRGESYIAYNAELVANQPVSGLYVERLPEDLLVGGVITFIPIRQLRRGNLWQIQIQVGWQVYDERGRFRTVFPRPITTRVRVIRERHESSD